MNMEQSEIMTGQNFTSHLNGAAIIDAEGREIPITEDMIRAALEALEKNVSGATTRADRSS